MLPVSLTFAAALALFNLWLGYRIVRLRLSGKVLVGTGDNPLLEARMRAHANFVEYSLFVLALVVLLELAGVSPHWLRGIGIVYLLARVAHAFGMDPRSTNPLRAGGILVTWAVVIGLSGWAVYTAYAPPHPRAAMRLL